MANKKPMPAPVLDDEADLPPLPAARHFDPVRIRADKCPLLLNASADGEEWPTAFPHAGQWVEVFPFTTTAFEGAYRALARGSDDERHAEAVFVHLARSVARWTLRDLNGDRLPQPHRRDAAIRELAASEIFWLCHCVLGLIGPDGEYKVSKPRGADVPADTPAKG